MLKTFLCELDQPLAKDVSCSCNSKKDTQNRQMTEYQKPSSHESVIMPQPALENSSQ